MLQPSLNAINVHQSQTGQGNALNTTQTVDFADVVTIILRRFKLILLGLLLCLIPAILYILASPKLYSATTTLLIDPRQGRSLSADTASAAAFSDMGQIESQIKLVSSQTVLKRVVETQKLLNDPEFGVSSHGILSRIFSVLGGNAAQNSKNNNIAMSVDALYKAVSIKHAERTYIVDIQVTAQDEEKSAQLANAVARAYLDDSMDARNQAIMFESEWVRDRLSTVQDKLKAAENSIQEYKQQNKIFDASGKLVNEEQINTLSEQIVIARGKTGETRAKFEQVQKLLRGGRGLDSLVDAQKSTTLDKLRAQAADIARQEANLRTTLGPKHPQYLEIMQQAADTQNLIKVELRRVASATEAEYHIAKGSEASLENELIRLQSISDSTNQVRPKLRQLEREAESQRAAFEKFSKIRDTILQQGADSPIARIIAPASVPDFASSPRKVPILVLALAGGLGLGLALALMAESLSRKRDFVTNISKKAKFGQKTANKINEQLSIPAFMSISAFAPIIRNASFNVVGEQPNSAYAQTVAQLCKALFINKKNEPNFVIVTANEPHIGITSLVANLGAVASAAGIRTLMIDANFANAKLSFYGIESGIPGLISAFTMQRLAFKLKAASSFYILSASDGWQETSNQLPKILPTFLQGELEKNFDLILIDAGVLSDDAHLAAYSNAVSQVLLVSSTPSIDAALVEQTAAHLSLDPVLINVVHIERPQMMQAA